MSSELPPAPLKGSKALVVGVANQHSIAYGCAKAFRELEAVFERIDKEWGRLDVLLHSIAFAPKEDLRGPLIDCSAEGFKRAMDVSCHSFVRMARLAAPLMKEG